MQIINNKRIGGILLIAGTAIGAGMLGLPVNSAPLGYGLASVLLIASWFFMYITGLLVLEVNLSFKENISYITMANQTLGKVGGWFNWLFFLGLLYSLLAAYVAGGGDLIADLFGRFLPEGSAERAGPVIWVLGFALVVFFGVAFADKINRIFMLFLMAAYGFLLVVAGPNVKLAALGGGEPIYIFAALPVVFASLAFHIIIPSLSEYLNNETKQLRQIIFWGSFLVLGIYLFWELVIFGLIPINGDMGLIAILKSGKIPSRLTTSLQNLVQNPWVSLSLHYFIFFAIASSFLGVAYGLFDLLRDGLNLTQQRFGRLITLVLTFLPPLFYAELYPQGFIYALSYAGIFVAIIHGLFPILMVIKHRHLHPEYQGYRVTGGWPLLALTALFFMLVIYSFVAVDMGWLPSLR